MWITENCTKSIKHLPIWLTIVFKVIHVTACILVLWITFFSHFCCYNIYQISTIFYNKIAFLKIFCGYYTSAFSFKIPYLKIEDVLIFKTHPTRAAANELNKNVYMTSNPSSNSFLTATSKFRCFSSKIVFCVFRTDRLTGKKSVNLWLSPFFSSKLFVIKLLFNLE